MNSWDVFTQILKKSDASPLLRTIDFAREMDISRAMTFCPLQDPFRFRARFVALEVANALIHETGALQLEVAQELHRSLEHHPFLIGPGLENDAYIFKHIQASLAHLIHNTAIQKLLQKFSPPLCHAGAERLIRDTLWPAPIQQIKEAAIKKAVIAAWFTWLRQTTGSCFATAPAILIQQNQPLQLIQDLFDLLTFGTLRRVVAGKEYAVPLCPSTEQFDLMRPIKDFSAELLSISPGLRAALGAAEFSLSKAELQKAIAHAEEAKTVKELIESILLRLFDLQREDVREEEGLKPLQLNPLLAKHSAVYYQKPSARALKVAAWKKGLTKAITAYQALGDCALIRSWEASVASFSDVKVDVAKWNLYVSLGLHPEFPGGIGAFAYHAINAKLAVLNQQIADLQTEYEQVALLAYNAEKRNQQGEFSHAKARAHSIRLQIEEYAKDGEKLSKFLPVLIDGYNKRIPEFFQEIFDPSLAQNPSEMIDDSPAGFRLVYKHGRSASSQWTFIRSAEEFIGALREFFEYAERELISEEPFNKLHIEQISTALVQYIQTDAFLEQSIQRIRNTPSVHDPGAMPWQYISGGTMTALLMTYMNRESPLPLLQKTIYNEQDLLVFLSQTDKQSTLMHSPTHAFVFHPHWLPFDLQQAIGHLQQFWKQMVIADEEWVAEKLAGRLPDREAALFLHLWRQQGVKGEFLPFRKALIEILGPKKESWIDSFLWESLPLISAKEQIEFADEWGIKLSTSQHWMTPLELREQIKTAFIAKQGFVFAKSDLDEQIANKLRQKGLAAPQPLLFADTNWSDWSFGLTISPASKLELWRFHRTGMTGVPMNEWFRLQCGGQWVILQIK